MPQIQVGETVYDFDPADVTNDEGIAVEKIMGCTFDAWNQRLAEGSMQAMTALVWLLQRRDNPGLRIDDVHFRMGDIKSVADEAEGNDQAQAASEVVPGGRSAELDPKDLTTAPEASTEDA